MRTIQCNIPDSLFEAMQQRMREERTTADHVVTSALSQSLEQPLHTLFQVSTSAALVEGLYQGAVRVSRLLQHGDFGLGTFVDLDGEMVILDGVCYRVSSAGLVSSVDPDRLVPYAVVTRFKPEFLKERLRFTNFAQLAGACDALRSSDNVFYAFRARGKFDVVKTRVMRETAPGSGLKAAAFEQVEFTLKQVSGTLVGLWSPSFTNAFSVPGYHFHFLADDRTCGGHVLDCQAESIDIDGCSISEMHVSLPETEAFLKADLSGDPNADLEVAERNHSS